MDEGLQFSLTPHGWAELSSKHYKQKAARLVRTASHSNGKRGRARIRDRRVTLKIGQTADVIDVGWAAFGTAFAAKRSPSWHEGSLTHTVTAALNAVTAPLLAVRSDGSLLFGNRAAHSLLRESRWLEALQGRVVCCAHSDSSPMLSAAIARLDCCVGCTVLLRSEERRVGKECW